ncbi:MAG: glycerophosphodiester phosphodiesterase family protein [Syntrophotaleaceae bacterium]
MKNFFIWAHRGASAKAPENTMAAFRLALEQGADGLELDVHLTRDGVPVVIHDATVDRTSNGAGAVSAMTWQEISLLDAGSWFDKGFFGEPIPPLVEVFQWNAGRLKVNVEIKESAAADAVVEVWRRFPGTPLVVSSFDQSLLEELSRKEPGPPVGFLCDNRDWLPVAEKAAACRAWSFHPAQEMVDALLVKTCHSLGLAVFPWTVDGPRRLETLWNIQVDGVFCNDPGSVRAFMDRFSTEDIADAKDIH